jgi:carboxypeptidase family protein/Big-like domain-containing protein
MRTSFAACLALSLLLAVAACGSSSSPANPNSPSSVPAGAVKTLHVTGPALVVGDVSQFTAMATMVDGTNQDVTAEATWTSSNIAVATVDRSGKVTAIKEGGVSIHAAFRNVGDSQYQNVTPLLFFKAAGTVTEAPPGFSSVVNAKVEIVGGSNVGTAVTTDGAGNFSFGSMRGDNYTFKVTRDGYQDLTQKVTLTRDQTNISLLLFPVPPAGATARCKDKSWSFAADKGAACNRNGGVSYWVCPGPFCS